MVCQGYAGSAPVKFMKQYADAGMKFPVIGGETAARRRAAAQFRRRGARPHLGRALHRRPRQRRANKNFLAACRRTTTSVAGQYAALLYLNVQIIEAALKATGGKTDDKDAFIKALRAVQLTDSRCAGR